MKHTLKQALALFIAVLLATLGPVGALSEGLDLEQVVSENIEPPVEEAGPFELGDLQLDDGGVSLQEGLTLSYDEAPEDIGGETVLELGDTEAETPVVEEAEPTEPFDQAVTIDGAVIAVTAEAGVFPEGAALRVEAVNSEAAAQAVEATVGVEGVYVHRQYRVEIVDGANNVILPDYEQGVPAVRVEGLDLPAGSRVAVYDETVPGVYEIDARVNEGAIAFALVDVGVYDIFTIEPPTEAQEEAPVEDETEEPAQQPAEGETEESAQQPTEGETEEPTEQSAEGDAEEPAEGETEEPVEQPAEGEAEESAEGEAEEESTDEVIEEPVEAEGEAIQPVSVVFDAMPETAVVTVWPAATEEVPVPEAIPAQEDGSFALLPGEYTYSAEADGYVSLENVPFTVTGDEQQQLLSFALEAQPEETPEPVAFEQSQTVNGVIVTVRAEPGVFPEGAELNVQRVPVYKQRQADAAVEEVRDENQNVAVSYTFDIKVIDPATREELQPAEGQKVEVSFALAEVADENLETSVYHIDDSGAAEKLDVTQEDEVTAGGGPSVSVETEGFSLYTVEFTYNTLEYVLPGDSSVPMSEILTTLGLAGEVTAVEISDTSLFSASNETGEWIVTAHQAFDTAEWMKVTINGVVYEIRVTDDGSGLAAIGYLYYADEAAAIAGTATTGSCSEYVALTDQLTTWGEANQTKWYVVNNNVTIADRITVTGNVNLILCNSTTLTVPKGIGVTNGNSLTIYGQSANESTMGAIDAQLGIQSVYNYLAAIGGGGSQNSSGQITVNGGKIIATGGTNAAGIGGGKDESGTVTINGGFITATSQYNNATPGAAIGGGNNGSGTVTINGGHIVATGGQSAAGIGSGYAASATVTINGGSIEAHGGAGAAGIGSGKYWNDSSTTRQATVYIHGGTVTADTKSPMYNTDGSAAIGGGAHSQGFVTIDGGHVTATAPKNCTCIGNYEVNYRQTGSVTITGGVVIAQLDSSVQASDTYYGIGGADCSVTLGWMNESDSITAPAWGKQGNNIAPRDNGVTFVDGKSFQYQDTHTLAEAASLRNSATLIPFIPAAQKNVEQADVSGVRAWYPHTGSPIEPEPVVTYSGTTLVKGTDYTLSYTSDHTNTGSKEVTITGIGNYIGTKTILYQIVEASTTYLDDAGSSQTCTIFQCLDQSDTALGAGWYLVYDDLTIDDCISLTGDVKLILKNGTTLTAQKGISVPSSASLTIYAQSNSESTAGKLETGAPDVSYPGIGGPYQANTAVTPGNITIVGGVINATGGVGASAIGGATYSPGGNITIKGGYVTAESSVGGGAAIGGGANADGGTINITGGKVTATGRGGAGIGGGSYGKSGTITISSGTVTATADGSAAIGGGSNGAGETINITGGTITATNSGETGGAAIGGGINAAGGKITIENATIAKATASAGAGIGSGGGETAGTTTVIIGTGAIISNAGSYNGAGIGSGQNSSTSCSVTIQSGANVNAGSTLGAGIGGGNGASNFSVTIQGGTVNAWAGGIGTQDGNGNLSAYGGAAIGGGANTSGGNVSISGGTVTARAIGGGAGIGSGANTSTSATTDSGTITISGGTVTATATHRAAGIGGGRRSNGGTITISGGTIVANGSAAAGIGHGGKDTLWEGQGSFHISIIDDPTQDVGGAWYDSIVPIDGTNIATTDGNVTFSYAGGGTVSITASSYPSAPTLSKDFMYSDNGVKVVATSITGEKTIIPYSAHLHSFTYSASGATITATCSAANSPLASSQATLTINAPTELIYDGTAKAVTVIGEIPGVTMPAIVYKQDETILAAAPVNAGTYTASITLGEGDGAATASVTYTIIPKQYTIVIGTDIDNGTVTADKNAFTEGETVTLTVTPAEGYALDSLTYTQDGSETPVTIENNTFTMPAGNVTVNAVFAKLYALNLPVGEPYGSVTAFVNGAEATEARSGETVSLVFTLNEGYQIQYAFPSPVTAFYTLDGTEKKKDAYSESGNTYTFTMPAADISSWRVLNGRSICTVWFDPDNEGTRSQNNVYYGDSVSCPDDPSKEGFRFLGWYQVLGESLADAPFDFEMSITGDITLRAKWEQIYAVAIDGNITGGEVTTDKATAAPDDTVTLTVEPATGYALDTLTVMQGEIPVTVTNNQFTMPAGDVTVSATFRQVYTLSLSCYSLGATMTAEVNGQNVALPAFVNDEATMQAGEGDEIALTVTPNDGYRVDFFEVYTPDDYEWLNFTGTEGENGAKTATFTMPDRAVRVSVYILSNEIRCNPIYDGENLLFDVTPSQNPGKAEETITLTVTKDDSVTLDSLTLAYWDESQGEQVRQTLVPDGSGAYAFTMPDASVEILAEIRLTGRTYTIDRTNLADAARVTVECVRDENNRSEIPATTANAGDTVRVYTGGATLAGFTVTDASSQTVETSYTNWESSCYTFTMPASNVTLTGTAVYAIRLPYDPQGGSLSIKVNGTAQQPDENYTVTAAAGDSVTVTATPNEGYRLTRLSYCAGEEGKGTPIESGVAFAMPACDITISADFTTPWRMLQDEINNAGAGETITLTKDVTATANDGRLTIGNGKNITIDLKGHTIDRHLSEPVGYGCVIEVKGTLTIQDSAGDGRITGGCNSYGGGGIALDGTLNLQGGTITGNRTSNVGGGVYVRSSDSVFNFTGGTIAGNTAEGSGRKSDGVFVNGTMKVSGSPVATDAVWIEDSNYLIQVTGPMTEAAQIAVAMSSPDGQIFTEGLSGNGGAANFKSADDDYRVRVNADGEAELKTVHSVTVAEDIANGTVTADLTTATKGDAVTLTATPAEGYAFSHFTVTDASGESVGVSPEGIIIMPDSNVTVTATFITAWKWLQNRMAEGWTITLEKDITCVDQSEGPLVVPKGVTSTLDLNGHTVDRGLAGQDAVEDGYVISVRGTLTVNDSSTDKTGKITGGNDTTGGGGVVLDGTFTLNGGAVTGNRTGSLAGGILNYGTFNMTGGAISDNSAQNAGGVYNGGTFNLSGGLICGNTASDNSGGGVYNNLGSVFNMSGSASIVRNHAATGGGVYNGGAFTLSESASITDNTANYGSGVANMGTFNMTGSAAITGNAATEAGGGLYHAGSAITLSGDIALSGNTSGDIHLLEVSPDNKPVLNISGALTNADPIGVSYEVLEGTLPDTIPFTQGLNGNGNAANFKSASDDYRVRVNDAGEAELYAPTFYTVTCASCENGSVTVFGDKTSFAEGDTVTLSAAPATGYVLTDLTVTYTDGEDVAQTITPTQDGTDKAKYTFTMPAVNVTATATFKQVFTISFSAGEGATGTMDSVTMPQGEAYTLPDASAFTAPEGKTFKEWSVKIGDAEAVSKAAGEDITVTADTTVTAMWEEAGDTPILQSTTVMFEGMIAIRYRYTIPESILNNGFIVLEKNGSEVERIALSDGKPDGGTRLYYYKVLIPEYADKVVAKIVDDDGNLIATKTASGKDCTEGFSYSAKDYAEYMKDNASSDEMKALAKALDDYGTAAQIHFKYGDYQSLTVGNDVSSLTSAQMGEASTTNSGDKPAWLPAASITVFFHHDNRQRAYFSVGDGDYTYNVDGRPATAKVYTDGRRYLDVDAIPAPELGNMHKFSISNGTDTYWIQFSAVTYAKTAADSGSDTMKNLGKALYLYYQAASAYFTH